MSRHDKSDRVTRRDFLSGAAYGTLGLAMGLEGLARAGQGSAFAAEKPLSQVVLVRNEAAVDASHQVNSVVVAEMLDTAMKAFTGENEVAKAWQRYFRPQDNVGIKYTRCSWHRIHVNQAVLDAITDRLVTSGVAKSRVTANDFGLPVKDCTALINVPTVKVHALTGIAVSIKNYINFTGPRKFLSLRGQREARGSVVVARGERQDPPDCG